MTKIKKIIANVGEKIEQLEATYTENGVLTLENYLPVLQNVKYSYHIDPAVPLLDIYPG